MAALACCLGACSVEPPAFVSVLFPEETHDTVGPYRVEAWLETTRGIRYVLLRIGDEDPFSELLFSRERQDDQTELWGLDLPGRPPGWTYRFFLIAVETGGKKATFPEGAPEEVLTLRILGP